MVLGEGAYGTVYYGITPGLVEFGAKRMEGTHEQQRAGKEMMTKAEMTVFIKWDFV